MSSDTMQKNGDAARSRHTMSTTAGIEDCLAVVNELAFELELALLRLQQVHKILAKMREGPQAYDPDTPAGERPGAAQVRLHIRRRY